MQPDIDASGDTVDGPETSRADESVIEPATTSRRGLMIGLGGFIVAGTAGFFLLGSNADTDDGPAGFPDLTFDRPDGSTGTLAEFAGTPMVLNLFASWCAPCRAEMPDLEAVSQEVSGRVRFFGLAVPPSSDEAAGMIEETGVTYDWGIDSKSAALTHYEGAAMPTTVFIRADGVVRDAHSGILSADDIRARVASLL
jgi:thiol-disulfide isomerase/thioredoxin